MGDIADMMLDGALCQGCGQFLNHDAPGYPCSCPDCGGSEKQNKPHPNTWYKPGKPKVSCKTCGKRVNVNGLKDHMRDAHGVTTPKGN